MKNIAIVVDSSCGLTENQAKKLDLFYLPLMIEVDGKVYREGIDVSSENLFEVFTLKSSKATTSATPIGYASELFTELSKKYDYIVVFPISQYLSSQYKFLKTLEKDFDKLRIIESVNISFTILEQINRFKDIYSKTQDIQKAIDECSKWNNELDITLIPKHNDYLVKGGRLSPAAATIAKLLKIVPLIRFENGKLEKQGKGRLFLKSIFNEIDIKFNNSNSDLVFFCTNGSDDIEIINYFKDKYKNKIVVFSIPSVVAIHTEPEAIVIGKINNIHQKLEGFLDV
ncbi:DegV family protein [Mycoplasmopsis felis]|uniref:DegV family protein n=1 Tax=Mycoplasmopsis felis TaxID=33923 RepID=UPI0021AF368D|nr:DegV family protein [Mycoplasmopsis felis]UWV85043.1 DegV family protein [Mycoplasmopsis felis]